MLLKIHQSKKEEEKPIKKKMESKPKVRLGNGKKRSDSWLTATICMTDAEAHVYTYNGKNYVNLNININESPDDYGKDVRITLNDYKKEDKLPF
jgi:hypothetical protein